MPVLYLLAGPNGTGKTTFYSIAVQKGFITKEFPFINVDLITQSFGGYTIENFTKAQQVYRTTVKKYIDSRNDFMIETNLADSRDYDWIENMNKNGYEPVLYYLSTDDVEINIARVKRRVAEGGHDIPEAIIRSRYYQSHSYLKIKLKVFKDVYLIDNSTSIFHVDALLTNGVITLKSKKASTWVNDVLSITEQINRKK